MHFELAGVIHSDPCCPILLQDWFKALATVRSTPPEFVAVEWDPDRLPVAEQRLAVKAALSACVPPLCHQVVQRFVDAVGFEADTHEQVFRWVETVWLDKYRHIDDESMVTEFASRRVEHYLSLLKRFPNSADEVRWDDMSRFLWAQASASDSGADGRDSVWAARLSGRLSVMSQCEESWAAIVVGKNHTKRNPGRLVTLLEGQGSSCTVTDMMAT